MCLPHVLTYGGLQAKLLQNAELMKNKIAILSLMELAFHKPSEDRLLTFSEIAQALAQPIENVIFFSDVVIIFSQLLIL